MTYFCLENREKLQQDYRLQDYNIKMYKSLKVFHYITIDEFCFHALLHPLLEHTIKY